ncbi:MAG: peptide deformylase [Butyricicoccaceae bacterium]
MIRPIVTDDIFLSRKSVPATKADAQVITDLTDTLRANLDRCVGMAANMIGVSKRIIVIAMGPMCLPMVNPVIVSTSQATYEADEGCLSHTGTRRTTRFEWIEVEYQNAAFCQQRQRFSGFPAQIIQHEIDHCDGILI